MMKTALLSLALLLQSGLVDEARKVIRPAKEFREITVEFTDAQKEAVGKAVGDAPAKFTFVKAKARLMLGENMDPQEVRIGFIDVETAKGKARIGIAIAHGENMVAEVRLMSGTGVLPEDSGFLSQFQGLVYSPVAVGQPKGALEAARKKAKEGNKSLNALIGTKVLMTKMQETTDEIIEQVNESKDATKQIEHLNEMLEQQKKYVEDSEFLENADRVREYLANTRKRTDALLASIKAGNWVKASADASNVLIRGCNRCHGSYQKLYEEKRAEMGLGNGFFRTDFDLIPDAEGDRKVQDQLGAAVRRAVLLMTVTSRKK